MAIAATLPSLAAIRECEARLRAEHAAREGEKCYYTAARMLGASAQDAAALELVLLTGGN